MLKLFLSLRYLRKKKIVLLSMAAVALSVALMIVVGSLFTGYIKALKASVVADVGDVFLWLGGGSIPQYEIFISELEELDGVEAAAPFLYGGGLLYLQSGDVREVTIQGIDPERETKFTDWKYSLLRQRTVADNVSFAVPGYADDIGGWLGIGVVADPNEQTDKYDSDEAKKLIGNQVILTTLGSGGKRKVVKLKIADIAFTQTYYGDKTLYLPLRKLNEITFGADGAESVRDIKIKLSSGADSAVMKLVIEKKWQQFATENLGWDSDSVAKMRAATVQELRGDFFAELHKQMQIVLLIFGVICSVAVLLIFCIFYMIVETKLKDIAIIKSCGATSTAAASIFLSFGACVGMVGSAVGIVIGTVVMKNINVIEQWIKIIFGLKLWQSSSYGLNVIPHQVHWPSVLPIVLAAVAGCCLGALIPAIVAARTKPVEILRYE